MGSVAQDSARGQDLDPARRGDLSRFREVFYGCLTARADELFELTDALLCTEGPVRTLVELALAPEHRRGHGALYDGLNQGRIEVGSAAPGAGRVAAAPGSGWADRARGGRVSPWLRPDAPTSPQRLFCHTYGRGQGQAQMIPGWPYSIVAALEPGRTSWTAVLDAVRLGTRPRRHRGDRRPRCGRLVGRLREAGQHRDGDPDILVVFDAGYDVSPAGVPARRSAGAGARADPLGPGAVRTRPAPVAPGRGGRPPRHGAAFALARPEDGPPPQVATTPTPAATAALTPRPGTGCTRGWNTAAPGPTTPASCRSSRAP